MDSASHSDNVVEIRNLRYRRGSPRIFNGLDIDIPRGKVTAIMGPSGVGKSTLMQLMTGQLLPDRGTIRVDGQDVPKLSRTQLYRLRERMGMLFQRGAAHRSQCIRQRRVSAARAYRSAGALIHHLVLFKLHAVGLHGAVQLMPAELSGGMARRVALARAMARDPEILIYDEPFVGLDPISLGVILRLVRRTNDALGLTSIVVSHDVEEIAEIADVSYLISDGKVVGKGTPDEMAKNRSAVVRQFMAGLADGPVPFHYPAPDYGDQLLCRD
jgi:phospholipid/cholesterol/gamma-HCH transport system ATP-binding protein